MLHLKLDKHFRTACQNSQCKTGTTILCDIFISFSDTVTNNTRGSIAYAAIHSLSWDNKKQSLNTFNSTFNGHLSCIHEANMDFTLQALNMCWIRALPDPFISVQAKFTQGSKLPDKWESAISVKMLYQATKHWATIYNISITPSKTLPTPPNPRDRDSGRDSDRGRRGSHEPGPGNSDRSTSDCPIPSWSDKPPPIAKDQRYNYPANYPTSQLFCAHLNTFHNAGKTVADITAMFKPAFANPGCFVCHIKEGHRSHHAETSCNFLIFFNSYVCRHTSTSPVSPQP